jgi:hypothetical protein
MKDYTTNVAENKEALNNCKSKCFNTPECPKNTTAKPTTTTTKYPITFKRTWNTRKITNGEYWSRTSSGFRDICMKEGPYKEPKYRNNPEGKTRQICRQTNRKISSKGGRHFVCDFKCTIDLV